MDGGWWIDVDGHVLPKPLSGHPALELCNTRSGWGEPEGPGQDYLQSYAHLVVAARHCGALEPQRADALLARAGRATAATTRELERVRGLRADTYAVLTVRARTRPSSGSPARWPPPARGRCLVRDPGGVALEASVVHHVPRTRWTHCSARSVTCSSPRTWRACAPVRTRLRLAVPRRLRSAPLVPDGRVRQPRQAGAAPRP